MTEEMTMNMYDTTPEHSKEYGLTSNNPLFVQLTSTDETSLKKLERHAKDNSHDLIFGHIQLNSKSKVDEIKIILEQNGFSTIEGNNDFYKQVQ